MFPWKPVRDPATLKGHMLSETILKSQHAERSRTLTSAPRSIAHPERGAAQRLDYRQAAPVGCRPGEKSPQPPQPQPQPQPPYGGQDFVKMTAASCGRLPLADPRTRPVRTDPGSQYPREPHLTSTKPQPAPDTGYSDAVASSMSVHPSTVPHHLHPHPSPFPHQPKDVAPKRLPSYGAPTPNDVTAVDREARRNPSQELHIEAARVATGQRASLPVSGPPASSVGIVQDWLRQVPFCAPAPPSSGGCSPTRRGSLGGKQPEVTSQLEYSPPLDLSLKQLNGKRRLPEVTDDDQPLDLSIKRQRKDVEDSDDDVILVGVHNPPNSAGYPGGSGHPDRATGSYDKRHVPMAHLGAQTLPTRPVTSDAFQPIQGRYASPRPMPVGAGAGYHVTANGNKHVIDSSYHVTRPPVPVPLPYSVPSPAPPPARLGNPMTSQRRMPSPLHRPPVPVPSQRRSVSPSAARPGHPSPLPASHLRHASPLPPPPPTQSAAALPQLNSARDTRHGVPLVWGLDPQKNKPDSKSAPSQYSGPPKRRDPSPYRRLPAAVGKRVQDLGLESRVGPPETYQGPTGQERHIQRIDKHQELLAYGKPASGSTWIPPTVCNGDVYQQGGRGVQKSPGTGVPPAPQRTTRNDAPIQKEPTPERCPSSGKERPPYLDPVPGSVRYTGQHGPYAATVPGLSTAQQEASKNGGKNGVQQVVGGSMTLSYIPKYVVTVQGNKLYQQPKPEKPYHELVSSAVPSTVEEPVRLAQQHPYPLMSVPIVKEENAFPGKSTARRASDTKAAVDDDDASAKSDQPGVDVGAVTSRADDGSQPQTTTTTTTTTATNMVSKTESMFVSAAHKMIPVANVHPIRKLTSGAADRDEGSPPEAKKDDAKDDGDGKKVDGKKGDVVVGELHQKIQITPNPLFSSHQDEFVRFLSRSAGGLPGGQRFSKKQLKMLSKSGLDKVRGKLFGDGDVDVDADESLTPDELRGKLAELHELEGVPRDLALHFSTPKGRHKLLTKRNSHWFDAGLTSTPNRADADGGTADFQKNSVADNDGAPPPDRRSDSQRLDTSSSSACSSNDGAAKKKAKGKRKKQTVESSANSETSERVPYKKRRRKKLEPTDDEEDPEEEEEEALLQDRRGAFVDADSTEEYITRAKCKKSRRYLNRESGRQADVVRRPYRRKNQRVMTRRKALRKSRRVALYDKNAAYEAELRKEEERRLMRRVRREERSQLLPPPPPPSSSSSSSSSSASSQAGADDLQLSNDAETDDVTDLDSSDNAGQPADVRALRSTRQVGVKRAARKLSLRKRVGCRKRKMLRDAVVELHPLSMRGKVKAKRLPMEKVMRRRLRKEARACANNNNNNNNHHNHNNNNNYNGNSRSITDNADRKRLFVCRETGETTLHKAARKGYVEAALQCLDSEMVDVNVRDNAGYTPLHESCVSGSLSIAKALIARGADANAKALDGTRPLHDAVDNNHIELVRLLLSQGADPTIANYGGRTPLKLARSTNMKAFISDYLADLRDEGPDWELSSFIGRQGAELGFDVLDGAPDGSCPDPGCEVFFDLCADPPLPMFFLRADKETGPRNYHLLNDVCHRLAIVNKEDFMLLNNDLRFVGLSKSAMLDQLRANALCGIDDRQLEQLEDVVQLVEIDSTLCQLLEVTRENLSGEAAADSGSRPDVGEPIAEAPSAPSSRKAARDPDADPEKAGDRRPDPDVVSTRSGRLTPPVSKSKERRRSSSNMRKSKSCTSLDVYDWSKTAVLRLSALNRSESSPNVQDSAPGGTAASQRTAASGCLALPTNSLGKDRRQSRCKRSEPCCTTTNSNGSNSNGNSGGGSSGGSPVRSKTKHHHQSYHPHYSERSQLQLDKAVLCNEMALTMTALAREVTKTVLAREVNRKVRLSSKRLAVDAPTAWNNCKPTSTKLAAAGGGEVSRRSSAPGVAASAVESRCRVDDVIGGVPADGRREAIQNGGDVLKCGAPQDDRSKSDGSEVVDVSSSSSAAAPTPADGADDVGNAPGKEPEESSNDQPAVDREPTPPGGAGLAVKEKSTSDRQTGAEPTKCTQLVTAATSTTSTTATSTTASTTHDGAPVTSEMALPVLENPFEEEGKQPPSVANEGGGLEEREMPELTLCTY